MFKQLLHTFAGQKWLRAWNPREKHYLLSLRIAETLDDAMACGMAVEDAWLIITEGSVGVSLLPPASRRKLLAKVRLRDVPSFTSAYRLLQREDEMEDTTPVTDEVEKAFDNLADEVLRQTYGKEYLKRLMR